MVVYPARGGPGELKSDPCPKRLTKVSSVTQQRPLELILARNLLSALSTPAFLVDEGGVLVFYNEAAGALLGKRFEELGTVGPEEWGRSSAPSTTRATRSPTTSCRW